MNFTRDRLHSIGWASLLTVCAAMTVGLTLRVNAVKSEVHQAERRIIRMRHEITFLQTEFETRSNQQQLTALNDVEFGYMAPRAQQYIEGERQLAALGTPRGPGAPKPIRVASATADTGAGAFPPLASLIGGRSQTGDGEQPARDLAQPLAKQGSTPSPAWDPLSAAIDAKGLAERLTRIEAGAARSE
jgi:hypothetical protein